MEQIVCPTCGGVSENSAKYCQFCGQSLRCKQCGTLLSREARTCPECGTAVPERVHATGQPPLQDIVPPGYNRLKIDQTLEEYHLDYIFSDQVAAGQESLITKLATARRTAEVYPQNTADSPSLEQLQVAVIAPQLPEAGLQASPPTPTTILSNGSSMTDGIWRVFGNAQGKVEQIEFDLKCDTQGEYVTRLVRMFLYAHQQLGHASVSSDDIHEMLDRISINSHSQSIYLSSDKQGLQKDGEMYKLTLNAIRVIPTYLAQIADPSTKGKFDPGQRKKTQVPRQRNRTKGGDSPEIWASESSQLSSQISHPKANALDNNSRVLLGLYGVRLARGPRFEVSASQLADYLFRAFEIKLTTSQVRHAMDRITSKPDGLAIKGNTGSVKITASGCAKIQETLNLSRPDELNEQAEGGEGSV